MKIRDLIKTNIINDGSRTLFESILVPEVGLALSDWKKYCNKGVLIGGSAVGYYCKPRSTTDIDLLFLTQEDIPKQVEGFKRIRTGSFQHNKTHVEVEVVSFNSFNTVSQLLVKQVIDSSIESNGIKVASQSGLVALKLCRMSRYDYGDIWSLIETGKVDITHFDISDEQISKFNQIKQEVFNQIGE